MAGRGSCRYLEFVEVNFLTITYGLLTTEATWTTRYEGAQALGETLAAGC